jgi:hypothetical protein
VRLSQIDSLTALAADLAEAGGSVRPRLPAGELALDLLAAHNQPTLRGGVSELNGDGTPLQLCLSSSARGTGVRFVADPAFECGNAAERLALSTRAVRAAMKGHGTTALEPLFDVALRTLVPDDDHARRKFNRGFLWLAAAMNAPGVAVYFDLGPLGDDAWTRVGEWLAATLPDPSEAGAALTALRPHIRLASAGLEGVTPGDARAKIYFRLAHAVPLATLGSALLASPQILTLLSMVVGDEPMRFSGAVFGLGFSIATGAAADAKLDLCGHCLPRDADGWWNTLEQLVAAYGVQPFDTRVRNALRSTSTDVAFVGVGVGTDGRTRLNLYLRGRERQARAIASSAKSPRDAIALAVRYLSSIRDEDGSWSDFRLPVGRSTEWVTAFVGLGLASVRRSSGDALAQARMAASWLAERRAYDAGWGYNGTTGADADSTGFALRLLAALGIPRRARDEEWLLGKWRPVGGFATYDGPLRWGDAHPCVTASAFAALSPAAMQAKEGAVLRYIETMRRADGTWPAYWWRSHAYSTLQHVRLLRALGIDFVAPPPADLPDDVNAFELACLAGIEHLAARHEWRDRLTEMLLATQRGDGAFPGAANLRVTDPDCAQPWIDPRGALYADERATITTAMALMTLGDYADE